MFAPCFAQPCGEMCRSGAKTVSSFTQENLCCVLWLALSLVSCTSLKYFDFVWISGSKSQLKINRSTLKQLKKKKRETQSTVWTKMTLSVSQLRVLSGACYICRWLIPPHLAFGEMSSHLWQARCPHIRHIGRAAFWQGEDGLASLSLSSLPKVHCGHIWWFC